MRPLLGTFVEITASYSDRAKAHAAISAAFAAVERVAGLMSFHDPHSEVSRLNRLAARQAVRVSTDTYEVLKCAETLHKQTQGVFDIAVAPELISHRLLPRHPFVGRRKSYTGRGEDVALLRGRRVRFLRPLQIDLGGIAKGFAVDQAVQTLESAGISSGCVNAGGDLRFFGSNERPLCLRSPDYPEQRLPFGNFRRVAVATSAPYFSLKRFGARRVSALIHPISRQAFLERRSVSVFAASCMTADALTKAVLFSDSPTALLERFQAKAAILGEGGLARLLGWE